MTQQTSLIELLAQIEPTDGQSANTLLTEFFLRRRPIAELAPALCSMDDRVVKQAAWITSELGIKAVELISSIEQLLRHHLPYVRRLAVDTILLCATSEHASATATALSLLSDTAPNVRRHAYLFCARVDTATLRAGVEWLQKGSASDPLVINLPWLLSREATEPNKIEAAILSPDFPHRLIGIIAAARLGKLGTDISVYSTPEDDEALQGFLQHWLADHDIDSTSEVSRP